MPSICFVHKDIGDVDRGGLCVLFKTLALGLARKGWEASCITSQNLILPGVETYKLPLIDNPWKHSREVTKLVKSLNPDVAECSSWRFELLDFVHEPDRKTEVVVRCEPPASLIFPDLEDFDKAEKELCRRSDLLLAISKFAKERMEKKYGLQGIKVVYNGVEEIKPNKPNKKYLTSGEVIDPVKRTIRRIGKLEIKKLVDENGINIIWAGKSNLMKGFDNFERIVEDSPKTFNFIINIGYSEKELLWKKKNYQRCIFVRSLSKTDQLSLWKAADVFLSTSRIEGFGLVVAEALSLGLPLVLNSGCKVYQEFMPNQAIRLVDVKDQNGTIKAIAESSSNKVTYSRNPRAFTARTMVEQSISQYQRVL